MLRDLDMTDEEIRKIGKIYIIACGSSYHVGVVGKYNLERMLTPQPSRCASPPNSATATPSSARATLVIVISQSGETLDTMAAMREAKTRGAHILSIVNVVGSEHRPRVRRPYSTPGPAPRSPLPPRRPTPRRWPFWTCWRSTSARCSARSTTRPTAPSCAEHGAAA